ncbi:MAG: proton-conducting transporter membrane subunit [Pseudomonadota bacterium]
MEYFSAENLFIASLLLYILAAGVSLVLITKQKACNLISNIFSMAAAALGAAASASVLLTGTLLDINILDSIMPFISISMKIDNLSAFFVLSLSILVFCVSLYSIGYISHYTGKRNVGLFYFLYATFILSMILVMTSSNTVFFYISWEAMSVLSYFLVIFESENEENLKAGTFYIVMTHIAAAFLLAAFMIMYRYTGSFDMFGSADAIPELARNIMFILFLIGFGTKAGVIPLHIWLPYAHPAAPSNVSALMSGIMIKTAIYGLLRFLVCYLGIHAAWWGVLVLCIGIVSAVLGIAYAFMEHNIKRLLAFSSVENVGVILIGLGVAFIAIARDNQFLGALALVAALAHTLNHALFKGGLFLGAGAIQYSTHTKDIEELGGLIKRMPVTAFLMLCFSLAISSIVPFNGFIGEWLTYQSIFAGIASGQAVTNILSILSVAALGLTGALAAACFVKLFGISFLGLPRSEHAEHAKEVPGVMSAGMGMLAGLCLVIGLFPLAILKLIDSVVFSLTGSQVAVNLQGGFVVAWYPLKISEGSISPLAVLIAIIAFILLSLLVIRVIGGKYSERRYGTWDCGFTALNSRMQYSATGFSKPINIVFRILYRPARETQVTGDLVYHPESISYTTTSEPIFEKYLYNPLYAKMKEFSKKTKYSVQTGNVHSYLLYIFITIIALMAYNRFV